MSIFARRVRLNTNPIKILRVNVCNVGMKMLMHISGKDGYDVLMPAIRYEELIKEKKENQIRDSVFNLKLKYLLLIVITITIAIVVLKLI